ncbi:MAG TPA: hypothetical protein ENN21_01020, partial [Spirochaetes bacterium]|nr:hypothetical protein [Spirochaetota bacterium]
MGKTLAYLIPSLLYCLENGKKLAVSTETKALQKQLLDKDIPMAREVISLHSGKSFTASLCLGSGNYPCRRRYEMLLAQGKFGPHQMRDIEAIGELFRNKSAFTRFDLRVTRELWGKIMRDPEVCHFHSCPFSSNCVFQQARRQWARSDLLVINHYLFFSNLRSGKSYLPAFDAVIFDEAHSLEEIASDQMGFSAGREDVKNVLEGLYRKGRKSGVFQAIEEPARRRKAGDLVRKTAAESETFFESLRRRIPPEKLSTRLRESLPEGRSLLQSLKEVYRALAEIDTLIEDEYRKMEYDILRARLFELIENLSLVIYGENEEYVFWIEGAEDQLLGDLRLRGQPVEVA